MADCRKLSNLLHTVRGPSSVETTAFANNESSKSRALSQLAITTNLNALINQLPSKACSSTLTIATIIFDNYSLYLNSGFCLLSFHIKIPP